MQQHVKAAADTAFTPHLHAVPGAPAAIDVLGVTKRYATRQGPVLALDAIDVRITAGSFVAILGPSGCGKSTLLKMVAGLEPVSEGQVEVFGTPVARPRAEVSVVFQSPVLFPWRTVLANVLLPAVVQRRDRETSTAKARELLRLVGLADFEQRYPWELSGGMQQRVAIARALLNDPSLLLMDEPFGALDAMTRDHMNVELQRIWLEHRKTVMLITHSIGEAVFLADRVLVMSARPGRILDDIAVDMPRPRALAVANSPRFTQTVERIRALFEVHERTPS